MLRQAQQTKLKTTFMEIERKFIVKNNAYVEKAFRKRRIVQGYICSDAERSVRVRICEDEAFLTIKSATNKRGWSRYEFEQPLQMNDANELIKLCQPGLIEKTRYDVKSGHHTWEVDVFQGENEGLVVAEIELASEDEVFKLPEWVGQEVSGEPKYYNMMLAMQPYTRWQKNN